MNMETLINIGIIKQHVAGLKATGIAKLFVGNYEVILRFQIEEKGKSCRIISRDDHLLPNQGWIIKEALIELEGALEHYLLMQWLALIRSPSL